MTRWPTPARAWRVVTVRWASAPVVCCRSVRAGTRFADTAGFVPLATAISGNRGIPGDRGSAENGIVRAPGLRHRRIAAGSAAIARRPAGCRVRARNASPQSVHNRSRWGGSGTACQAEGSANACTNQATTVSIGSGCSHCRNGVQRVVVQVFQKQTCRCGAHRL